jgi:hypothetical protein
MTNENILLAFYIKCQYYNLTVDQKISFLICTSYQFQDLFRFQIEEIRVGRTFSLDLSLNSESYFANSRHFINLQEAH